MVIVAITKLSSGSMSHATVSSDVVSAISDSTRIRLRANARGELSHVCTPANEFDGGGGGGGRGGGEGATLVETITSADVSPCMGATLCLSCDIAEASNVNVAGATNAVCILV